MAKPKADRVKYSTRIHGKRKVFCVKKDAADFVVDDVDVNNIQDGSPCNSSISSQKLEHFEALTPKKGDYITGYRIIDTEILANVFEAMNCPSCSKPGIKLSEHIDKRKGLASLLFVSCTCGYQYEFRTSAVYDHSYDVNKRMVYAMRNCGQGYSGIEKFTSDEYPQADDAQQL